MPDESTAVAAPPTASAPHQTSIKADAPLSAPPPIPDRPVQAVRKNNWKGDLRQGLFGEGKEKPNEQAKANAQNNPVPDNSRDSVEASGSNDADEGTETASEHDESAPKNPEVQEPADQKDPQYKGSYAKELRKAYEKSKTDIKRLTEERDSLQKKVRPDGEFERLTEAINAKDARLKELEEKVKYYDYTKSSEFVDKFQKPYETAAAYATKAATDLSVRGSDGTAKKVTEAQFWDVVRLQSEDDAMEAAHALFNGDALQGTKAARLLAEREKIVSASRAMENAKNDFASNVSAREKEMQAAQLMEREIRQKEAQARAEAFRKHNAESSEKFPKWFKPVEGDEESNKLLESGKSLADSLFNGNQKMTNEERIKSHSDAYLKIMGFDRVALDNKRKDAEIAKLQKELAGYKASGPGNGAPTSRGTDKKGANGRWTMADSKKELRETLFPKR